MRRIPIQLLLAIAALLGSCDSKHLPTEADSLGDLLRLAVSDESIPADGISELTVTAIIGSEEPDSGKLTIQFETSRGTLLGGTTQGVICLTSAASSCIQVQADRGSRTAQAQLRSSTQEGAVTVTAVLTAVSLQASEVVTFTAAEEVLSFLGTASSGEADGETTIRVMVAADSRVEAGKQITFVAEGADFATGNPTVDVPLGADSSAETFLKSPDTPRSVLLTASVKGEALAPARHQIDFDVALPASILVTAASSMVAPDATIAVTAELFRDPGAGSATEGLSVAWGADAVAEDGTVLVVDVGRFFDITPVKKDNADTSRRLATATFEATGLTDGERVRITARVGDIAGETTTSVVEPSGSLSR